MEHGRYHWFNPVGIGRMCDISSSYPTSSFQGCNGVWGSIAWSIGWIFAMYQSNIQLRCSFRDELANERWLHEFKFPGSMALKSIINQMHWTKSRLWRENRYHELSIWIPLYANRCRLAHAGLREMSGQEKFNYANTTTMGWIFKLEELISPQLARGTPCYLQCVNSGQNTSIQ